MTLKKKKCNGVFYTYLYSWAHHTLIRSATRPPAKECFRKFCCARGFQAKWTKQLQADPDCPTVRLHNDRY